MHDDCRQIVETAGCVGTSGLVQVAQEEVGHVEVAQGEVHLRVQLRPGPRRPAEALQVQAQHVRQAADPELLGRRLLATAPRTEEPLRVRQLLHVRELLQAI